MPSNTGLPEGISLDMIDEYYRIASTQYSKPMKKARMLDLADNNKLWEAISAKFPKYQILPETNHVSYIKNNIISSIYVVGKAATLLPTSEADKDIVALLNTVFDYIWTQLDVARYQLMAGERAALLNLGVTQVGWDNSVAVGSGKTFYKGRCILKNINPLRYMRDPFAPDIDTAGYAFTWDFYHKSVIAANPNYRERFKELEKGELANYSTATMTVPEAATDRVNINGNGQKDYYKVITSWIRDDENKIHEIHTIDNKYVLFVKENIQPSAIPVSELFCNLPGDNLFGNSEPNKILANSLAYNLMNSILLTSEYKNQRPPKFVSAQSGLNVATFTQHGNEADKTFVVNGPADKAVHYHQFPQPSEVAIRALGVLAADVKGITGVDDRYTGRDTGSILTTGGMNSMLDQVTMIDAPKVANYEAYSKRLAQLIISNHILFSATERTYLVKNPNNPKQYKEVVVDFPKISNDAIFNYELAISAMLPKNKTTIATMANKLMEMQLQYSAQNVDVDLITPQEWLMLQDIPIKEYMLERMGIQRTANWLEATSQIINQYAGLVGQGVAPDKAMAMTAETMQTQSQPNGSLEQVAQAMQTGGLI